MPIKRRQGENKEEFISRCIPIEITNGKSGEQAAAICYSYWEEKQLTAVKNIRKKNYKELQLLNMNIFGYRPKNFDMCPGAVSLFEHLMSMISDEDVKGMIRSAAQIADNIFGIEKKVIGDNKAMIADVYEAEILLDDFEDLMEEIDVLLGMEHDVDFMEGHLEIIEGYLKNDVLEFKKVRAFVQSSNVDKVMYDDIETRLVVQFMDGSIYTYEGVTQSQFDNIVDGNAAPITTDSRKPPRWKMGEGPSVGAALYKWLTKRDKGTKGGNFR
jgi:hypothetical protein